MANQNLAMNTKFLKIPLPVSKLIEGQEILVCNLKESISQNLELIIMTRFGEHRYDFDFGCEIWDLDFELIVSENKWEEKLRQSLLQSITTHEDRLSEIQLSVKISEIEKQNLIRNYTEIKKRVDIVLSGVIRRTGESFSFNNSLFLRPLS